MHALFEAVLRQKNLSKAGDLFSLEDVSIIKDLRNVLPILRDIVSGPDFPANHNDQSLVEICVTRLTSAIRETRTIEHYADGLVDLLETCLNYNLRPLNGGPDPPHAKIASDVMSCIFLNYSKKNVMRLSLPVSVKFLHKGNKDLSRNMSSYLSLAAIENAELLAQHIQPIIDSVISGNYSLSRVLPQIYSVNRDPIKSHVMTLVSILPNCENSEKLALLSLFSLVAKDNPALLEPSIPQLSEGLSSQATAQSTLQVFRNMAETRPQPLADQTACIKLAAENFPKTSLASVQLMCLVAKTGQEKANEALDFVLSIIGRMEEEKHSVVLKEVLALAHRYPSCLTANVINRLASMEDSSSSSPSVRSYIQELRNEFNAMKAGAGVTIVKVGGVGVDNNKQQANSSALRSAVRSITESRSKVDSRSTGRLPTHRSMTKLNGGQDVRLSTGLHKSMTRLNTSHQNMSRFNSNGQMSSAARSVTCMVGSRLSTGGGPASLSTPAAHAVGGYSTTGVRVPVAGASSPTKSMSSGSMSAGLVDPAGREILTVNVNQINQDLIRQVTSVSESVFQQCDSAMNNNTGPLSYNNGGSTRSRPLPISTSQPPSLALPSTKIPPASSTSNVAKNAAAHFTESQVRALPASPRRSNLSNTLPSPRRRQQMKEMMANEASKDDTAARPNNRISVFEPYPMRDTVQHFCEKHLNKIKSYMESLMVKLPLPIKCTIEERKGRKHAKLHFACQGRTGEHCLYKSTFYTMKTRNPRTWIHLMFLALQARSTAAISTRESSVSALKNCWEILKCENNSFVTLVTGAFPPPKAQDNLMHELRSHRFFDVFEYNGPRQHWGCFLCNHPDRATYFVEEQEPVIEGQLKEKKGGRWKLFKKWKSRYFTLSGDKLMYKDTTTDSHGAMITQTLDVGSIRSVKVAKEGRRNIPKAFEIFTEDKTYVLKAKDGSNAQEWVQCLSVAKAHSQAKDTNLKRLAYGGSLGRLNHHGRVPIHHSSLNTNLASLRTAV